MHGIDTIRRLNATPSSIGGAAEFEISECHDKARHDGLKAVSEDLGRAAHPFFEFERVITRLTSWAWGNRQDVPIITPEQLSTVTGCGGILLTQTRGDLHRTVSSLVVSTIEHAVCDLDRLVEQSRARIVGQILHNLSKRDLWAAHADVFAKVVAALADHLANRPVEDHLAESQLVVLSRVRFPHDGDARNLFLQRFVRRDTDASRAADDRPDPITPPGGEVA